MVRKSDKRNESPNSPQRKAASCAVQNRHPVLRRWIWQLAEGGMPADFTGYWKMVSNDNFEEYLKALGKVPFLH